MARLEALPTRFNDRRKPPSPGSPSGVSAIGLVMGVPVPSDIDPPRQIPPTKELLWHIVRDAKRLDYLPGLRVNYRKYGVDDDTRKAIRELLA